MKDLPFAGDVARKAAKKSVAKKKKATSN
jgi:hypothetical protein